jgi:hypothetical protein
MSIRVINMCQCNHTYCKHSDQIAQIGCQPNIYMDNSFIDKMPNFEAWRSKDATKVFIKKSTSDAVS